MQAWGSDNSSMRGLQTFDVNNCNLTGALPAAWSQNLPALQEINASANALSGAMHLGLCQRCCCHILCRIYCCSTFQETEAE